MVFYDTKFDTSKLLYCILSWYKQLGLIFTAIVVVESCPHVIRLCEYRCRPRKERFFGDCVL